MSSIAKLIGIGVLWQTFAVLLSKVSSILALIVLGWILSKEQFAIYALAISASSIMLGLKNGGVQPLLIQGGERTFNRLFPYFSRYAHKVNLLLFVCVFIASVFYSNWYDSDELQYLMWVIGLSIPLSFLVVPYRVILSFRYKFNILAKIDAFSALTKNGLIVILALAGFGVYSFVFPLVFIPFVEYFVAKHHVQDIPKASKRLKKIKLSMIFNKSKWILLAALCTALILQGDYLVLGFFEDKHTIGVYFFGFQLSASASILITKGMRSVMLPVFSSLKVQTDRQSKIYEKSIISAFIIMGVVSFGSYFVAPVAIDFLWDGDWNEAIVVVQLMMFCLLTKITTPLSRSLMEANGKWKIVTVLLACDAIGTMCAALVGAYLGEVLAIALSVAIYRFIYGFLNIIIVSKIMRHSVRRLLYVFVVVITAGCLGVNVFYMINELLDIYVLTVYTKYVIAFVVYLAIYLMILYLFCRKDFLQIMSLLNKKTRFT